MDNVTADNLTPHFQRILSRLKPIELKVLVVLADLAVSSTAMDVAAQSRRDVSNTSATLIRLIKKGLVVMTGKIGKRHHYQVSDPRLSEWWRLRRRGAQSS